MRTSVIREFKECLRNNTKYRIIVLTIADVNVVAFICFVCVTLNHKIFYRRHRTLFLWFRARPLLCSCFPFLSPSVTIICFLFSSFLSPFLLLLSLLFLFHKVGLTRGLKESSFQSRGTCLLVFVLAEWIMKPYFVSPITSSPERSQCSAWLCRTTCPDHWDMTDWRMDDRHGGADQQSGSRFWDVGEAVQCWRCGALAEESPRPPSSLALWSRASWWCHPLFFFLLSKLFQPSWPFWFPAVLLRMLTL